MTTRSFNYYGYDKETYRDCLELIHHTNRKHITILNTWFLLINILYLIFCNLNLFGVTRERAPFFITYIAASIIFEIWLLGWPKAVERYNFFAEFMSLIILVSYGIFSSIAQPYMPATIFLILLALTALSYIGNIFIMVLQSLVSVGLFLFSSYSYKTFSIAYHDTYNVAIVLTLAITLHYTFQRMRIHQFILYQKNLQIQRELEIKSSFDALTFLLNRGRFFSIAEEVLRQNKGEYMTLCLLDLDGFKQINDTLGHQMGDKVIQTVGRTIVRTLGLNYDANVKISSWNLTEQISLAGRLGGDEFITLIRGKHSKEEVRSLLQKMLDALNSVNFDNVKGIHASFGVTELTSDDYDMDSSYKRADEALYISKRAGKNQIRFSEDKGADK